MFFEFQDYVICLNMVKVVEGFIELSFVEYGVFFVGVYCLDVV